MSTRIYPRKLFEKELHRYNPVWKNVAENPLFNDAGHRTIEGFHILRKWYNVEPSPLKKKRKRYQLLDKIPQYRRS